MLGCYTCTILHIFHVTVITVPCPFIIILPVDLNYSDQLTAGICSSTDCIMAAYKLINALCVGCSENIETLSSILIHLFYSGTSHRHLCHLILQVMIFELLFIVLYYAKLNLHKSAVLHAVGVALRLTCLLVYNVHVLVNEPIGGGVN